MNALFDERRYLIPFKSRLLPQIFTDTLVIGAGVAGLRAALSAHAHGEVIVLGKAGPTGTSSAWAQGGVAVPIGPSDSPRSHARDTVNAGAGLCDASAVRLVVDGAAERIRELLDWGLQLDRGPDGALAFGTEAAHAHPRVLHANGDETGRELVRCLYDRVCRTDAIRFFDGCFAIDLLSASSEPGAPVLGALTHHARFGLQVIWARATILATGGASTMFRETTNPTGTTGDGLAMAFRAGAYVADMAFVQFHPTALYIAGAPRALISEAVRGEGAHLVDHDGTRFMLDADQRAELAPRDVVSRAIAGHLRAVRATHVFLDARHLRNFARRFPAITALLRSYELDPASDLIPIKPAAHYVIGGVHTDLAGRTNVPGLYAAGEVASIGLHGANRLASNSLLEGLVMGEVAGRAARESVLDDGPPTDLPPSPWTVSASATPPAIESRLRPSDRGELDIADVISSLRSALWRNAGVERSGVRLRDVADMIDFWARYTLDKVFNDPSAWQAQNLLLAGALLSRAAVWREESRGCHWREDTPEPCDVFRVHDLWRRGDAKPTIRAVDTADDV